MYDIRREKTQHQSRTSSSFSSTSKIFILIFIASSTIYYYYNKEYILSLVNDFLPSKQLNTTTAFSNSIDNENSKINDNKPGIVTSINSNNDNNITENIEPVTLETPAKDLTEFFKVLEEEWWELEKTNDYIFDQFRTSSIYLRFADLDENSIHSCYEYKVIDSQLQDKITHYGTFCYPSVIVTGARKCSTSALFSLLTQYPHAIWSGFKENCIFNPSGDRSIIQYFDSLPRNVESGEIIVDGCVDLEGNMKIRKMLREPNTFYIVLIRDYADWLWSAYNFWCQQTYDKECSPIDHWVNPDIHIRSPELFHDIITGSINGTFVNSPLLIKKPCIKASNMFRGYIDSLWSNVPVENTIVLSSEELDKHPESIWNRLAESIGLLKKHPNLQEFNKVRYNTQLDLFSRGESKTVSVKDYKPGLYAVSKFKPMLSETRKILNTCWKDECIWATVLTGHKYTSCSGPTDKFTYNDIHHSKDSNENNKKNIKKYLGAAFKTNNSNAFLEIKALECKSNFESFGKSKSLVVINKDEESSNHIKIASLSKEDLELVAKNANNQIIEALLQQLEQANKALTLFTSENKRLNDALKKQSTTKTNRALAISSDSAVFFSNGLLLLSLSKDDRKYVASLAYYASRFQNIFDTDDKNISSSLLSKICDHKSNVVISTNPSNIKLVKIENNNEVLFALKNDPFRCSSVSVRAYSRVIVILRDSVTSIWTKYQRENGFGSGLFGDAITSFDWGRWENSAIVMLANASSVNDQSLWTSSQSKMIDSMNSNNKLTIRLEDLMFSQLKLKTLFTIVEFIKSKDTSSSNQYVISKESLKCSHLMANAKNSKKYDYLTGRSNIDLAYASEDLICKIKQFYDKSPLQLSALILPKNTSCIGGKSTHVDLSRKCKLRYDKKVFLSVVKHHPVALLTMPGPYAVNARLLMEHSTSIVSGSMNSNKWLFEIFRGEPFCGQRQSIIHANPKDVTIKFLRSGKGGISLNNQGVRKCRKGMVRGFAKGLLLVRDPFLHSWREYKKSVDNNYALADGVSSLVSSDQLDKMKVSSFLNISNAYTRSNLLVYNAFDLLQAVIGLNNAIIVSYEALINPNPNLESTPYSRTNILKTITLFANYPSVYEEKLRCAYHFIEAGPAIKEVEEMNFFFLSHPKLICDMNKNFKKVLHPNKFNTTRLYDEVKCV